MKKKEFLAGVLALALLAGCSAGGGKTGPGFVGDPDDIAFQVTDIKRDAAIVTVDGEPITAESYLFWLASSIQSAMQYGELTTDDSWKETLSDGMTMSEALKADALETAKLYRVVETKAKEYGVSLTNQQEQEIADQMAQAMESVGGEEKFLAQLESMCISLDAFTALNRVYFLNQGLREKLEESGEIAVTAEDREQFTQEIIDGYGLYAAKHILLSTRKKNDDGSYEEFSEEERAAVLEQANAMRQQLREAGDSEELFDKLMNEYSEDGRDEEGNLYAPDGYGLVYGGQMVPEFEAGARSLKEGEISEPIATSYGYHIIMRIPLDSEELDRMVEYGCTPEYKLQQLTEEWMAQAQVVTTAAYDELDPKEFFERLTAINQAREAARQGAESENPEESPAESPAT